MIERKFWPNNLTDEVITAAVERQMFGLDNPGFCLACGLENDGCEPDARRYRCSSCDTAQVYGAQELLLCL
jgi:hypothetical protein